MQHSRGLSKRCALRPTQAWRFDWDVIRTLPGGDRESWVKARNGKQKDKTVLFSAAFTEMQKEVCLVSWMEFLLLYYY